MTEGTMQLKPIEKPVYHYWEALYKSFYSPPLYRDVGKRWQGLGLLYLVLVIGLFSLPYAIKNTIRFVNTFNQQIVQPFSQIPLLYVQNGKISADKPMPYLIKNNKGEVLILIDTTGKIREFTSEYPSLNVLITQNTILIKPPKPIFLTNSPNQTKMTPLVQTLDSSVNGIIDGKTFLANNNKLTQLKWLFAWMLYPLFFSMYFAIALVFFPVIALLAQFISNVFFSFRVNFAKSCRLLIVSATPMLLFVFILMYFGLVISRAGIIMLILLFGYYSFAIVVLKKDSQRLVS